jgi:hypothetical protein
LLQVLYPEDTSQNSFFGASVAVDRQTLAVGIQGDSQGIGSVRVDVNNDDGQGFVFQALLEPSDGAANDDFGRAVAISGDFIIVGAQRHDTEGLENAGAAYIYERSASGRSWNQVAKLTPSEPQADERFGISVSIQGKVAIVGANGDDSNGENSGAAYIFTLEPSIVGEEQWTFTKKLVAPDGTAGDNFGFSVSNYGNHAVVGAVWANDRAGSAYVFINQGGVWTSQGKFVGSSPDEQFGWSVSMYKETIAVGATKFDDRTTGPQATREVKDRGSVTIFVKDDEVGSWSKQAQLEPTDGKEGDHFGRSLDLHEDWLIVSAPYNDERGLDAGTAYMYQRDMEDGWLQQAQVFPTHESAALSEFGFSVGVSNYCFIVSSKSLDTVTGQLGNVYVYSTRNPNEPTASPTLSYPPTVLTTRSPTVSPRPSETPSQSPSSSLAPTALATASPTVMPSIMPSQSPSAIAETSQPSEVPSSTPSSKATTAFPTFSLSSNPSNVPSGQPSNSTTYSPTTFGGVEPPSGAPSVEGQTKMPTYPPTPGASLAPDATAAPSPSVQNITSAPNGLSTFPPTTFIDSTGAPTVATNGTSAPTIGTNGTSAPTVGTNGTNAPTVGTNGTSAPTETKMPTYSPTGAPAGPTITSAAPTVVGGSDTTAPTTGNNSTVTTTTAPTTPKIPTYSPTGAPAGPA